MSLSGYSLTSYGRMITCEPRMSAFDAALQSAIMPGCRVLEIGTGPGIMALLACRYGAGQVVAIEPDPSIEVARRLAVANGYADTITFVRDRSTNWQPDALADVVVSDIRGVMPLFEQHIPCIIDTRAR
jgi:protein arginine N-methyltransferase 1